MSHPMRIGSQAGVPLVKAGSRGRCSNCTAACVPSLGPAASHGRAPPVVVHCFFSYFPVVCSFFGFFRAVGCLLRRCATLSCLPSLSSLFLSFALFDHRHTHFHHYPPPTGEGGRSPACVCLGFPSPPARLSSPGVAVSSRPGRRRSRARVELAPRVAVLVTGGWIPLHGGAVEGVTGWVGRGRPLDTDARRGEVASSATGTGRELDGWGGAPAASAAMVGSAEVRGWRGLLDASLSLAPDWRSEAVFSGGGDEVWQSRGEVRLGG